MSNFFKILLLVFLLPLFVSCNVDQKQGNSAKEVQGNLYVSYNLSPDGRTIVFSGAGNGGKDLYTFNLATHAVTQLTNTSSYENYPAFSPDGHRIVYQAAQNLEKPRYLFIRSLDGRQVRQLTYKGFFADFYPAFSHNGQQVVFSRARQFYSDNRGETTWNSFDIYIVNSDGTHLQRLTSVESKGFIRPVFSPDDKRILFEETTGDNFDRCIMQVIVGSHSPPQMVIKYKEGATAVSFFPDGRHVVFVGNDGSGPELMITTLGGAQVSLNTVRFGNGSGGYDPKVAPDGRKIYFLDGDDSELWQIDVDGRNGRRIAKGLLFSDPTHMTVKR